MGINLSDPSTFLTVPTATSIQPTVSEGVHNLVFQEQSPHTIVSLADMSFDSNMRSPSKVGRQPESSMKSEFLTPPAITIGGLQLELQRLLSLNMVGNIPGSDANSLLRTGQGMMREFVL